MSFRIPANKSEVSASNLRAVAAAAERVTLAVAVNAAAAELYGVAEPVLDEKATMRRVALFYRGAGDAYLEPAERDAALGVIRGRFALRYEA